MAEKKSTSKKKANPAFDIGAGSPAENNEEVQETSTGEGQQAAPAQETASEAAAPSKVMVVGAAPATSASPNAAVALNKDIQRIKVMLEKAPTVKVYIPKEPHEPANACEDVWINGYHTRVPKGVMSDVKLPIFEILDRKYKLTNAALSRNTIAGSTKPGLEEALS